MLTAVGPDWVEVSGPSEQARAVARALMPDLPRSKVVVYSTGPAPDVPPVLGWVRIRAERRRVHLWH